MAQLRWAALAVVVLAVYGSLLPFNYAYRPLPEAYASFCEIQFLDSTNLAWRGDWVVSTALYSIVSFLLMAALCVDRPLWSSFAAAPFVALGSVALCIAVEFAQTYFPPRTVSLNDILFESLGVLVGTLAWLVGGQSIVNWLRRLGKGTTVAGLAARLFPGYLAVFLIVQLMPFDFVVSVDELQVKYADQKIRLLPGVGHDFDFWAALTKSALNLAGFVPLGVLVSLARSRKTESGKRKSLLVAAWTAPILIECLQLFVYTRTFVFLDMFTGLLGVYLGRQIGRIVRQSRESSTGSASRFAESIRSLWPILFLIWLGVVVYLYWHPFDFTNDPAQFLGDQEDFEIHGYRRLALAPFADYYWGSKYNALDQFARKGLSFMPLGVLAALTLQNLYQRAAAARVTLTAAAIAFVLEAGRYFLPSHVPSTTDVLIASAGAWFAFRVTQHIRITFWADDAFYGWMCPPDGRNPLI